MNNYSALRSLGAAVVLGMSLANTTAAETTFVSYSPITVPLLSGPISPVSSAERTSLGEFIQTVSGGAITREMVQEMRQWSPSFYTGMRLVEAEVALPQGMVAVMTLVLDDANAEPRIVSGSPTEFFNLAMEYQLQFGSSHDALSYIQLFTRLVACSSLRGFEENLPATGIPDTCRVITGPGDILWHEAAPVDLSQVRFIETPVVTRAPNGDYSARVTVLQGAALYNVTFLLNHRSGVVSLASAHEVHDIVPALAEISAQGARFFAPLSRDGN